MIAAISIPLYWFATPFIAAGIIDWAIEKARKLGAGRRRHSAPPGLTATTGGTAGADHSHVTVRERVERRP